MLVTIVLMNNINDEKKNQLLPISYDEKIFQMKKKWNVKKVEN